MHFTITTSWDDGHTLDLRLADLLDECGLRGTFYIARDFLDDRLSETQIRDLATRHEIGAHTLTHPILTQISETQLREEIIGSKMWLEDVLGESVTSFCYPRGKHNATVRQITQNAGFALGRTTEAYQINAGDDVFSVPTTLQIYPFPLRPLPDVRFPRGLRTRLQPLTTTLQAKPSIVLNPTALRDWPALATHWLDDAAATGGVFHVWGHSWEIERFDLWDDLRAIFERASRYTEARFVTNAELISDYMV